MYYCQQKPKNRKKRGRPGNEARLEPHIGCRIFFFCLPCSSSIICVNFSAAVVDLKNEHELDKQHLQRLHRQEVEAMKTAHSHTRYGDDVQAIPYYTTLLWL